MKINAIEYYNHIAEEYDKLLDTEKDRPIREDVYDYCKNLSRSEVILDYGGGTGLDLEWLSKCSERVLFYEPAIKMREIAAKRKTLCANGNRILILSDEEYSMWGVNHIELPKVNCILLNFGVINYIVDLDELFKKFHSVTDTGAVILINLLLVSTSFKIRKLWKSSIKSIFSNDNLKASSHYKGIKHETILYDIKDIKKGASKYFELRHIENLGLDSDFHLLHFEKI